MMAVNEVDGQRLVTVMPQVQHRKHNTFITVAHQGIGDPHPIEYTYSIPVPMGRGNQFRMDEVVAAPPYYALELNVSELERQQQFLTDQRRHQAPPATTHYTPAEAAAPEHDTVDCGMVYATRPMTGTTATTSAETVAAAANLAATAPRACAVGMIIVMKFGWKLTTIPLRVPYAINLYRHKITRVRDINQHKQKAQ
jgi:hypothetical protein